MRQWDTSLNTGRGYSQRASVDAPPRGWNRASLRQKVDSKCKGNSSVNEEHRNDISIGSNQWIEWIDISGEQDNAVEIDSVMLAIADFWNKLETQCVAECCGIDAFDFRPEEVKKAGAEFDIETLRKQLQNIEAEIQSLDSEVLVSTRLNNYFHRDVFIKLLQHLVLCFDDKVPG